MKKIVLLLAISTFSTLAAFASVTPTLSLSNTGNGDTVQVNVTADPNSSVFLFYTTTGNTSQVRSIGTTDANGNFSTTVSSSQYSIIPNSVTYVTIGGLSGLQSTQMMWPSLSNSGSNNLSLSQTNLNIGIGQTSTIVAGNYTGSNFYVLNNSNPSVATVSISSNQIIIYGSNYGSTVVNICSTTSTNLCSSININVSSQGTSTQSLTFSQNNIALTTAQSQTVAIYGGYNSYTISNNSNPNIVSASISGSNLLLYGFNTNGTASIYVCSNGSSNCGTLTVTVNGSTNNSNQIYLNQTTLSLNQGQTNYVPITGGGSYYLSSNSNPNVATAVINGSNLQVTGVYYGTDTIIVCQNGSSQCATLYVTVNNNNNNNNSNITSGTYLTANLNLLIGQTLTLTSSNTNGSLNLSSNPNPAVANATISGNAVTISGIGYGTNTIVVCQTGTSSCGTYNITVQNPNSNTNTNTNTGTISSLFKFYTQLYLGMRGDEVYELQKRLASLGIFFATPNGIYGPATRSAVMNYQRIHGISQTGILGPITRNELNR